MSIRYINGDLFAHVPAKLTPEEKTVFIVHVCNCVGAWGAGFVLPLAKAYPKARDEYLALKKHPLALRMGVTQQVQVQESGPEIFVENMIAQVLGGVRPLNYAALVQCMEQVTQHIEGIDPKGVIYAPMFGSALAGGDWNFIEKLIEDCWLANNIPVTICYLPQFLPKNWTPPE